ncbi:hypothetical protein F2P56_023658 [Juglans regia]|uniref:Major facilitator superfamily (MFS) profile domain-containing protein n=1 Tax=Juglans regia TaxID=51240 RepID=A0A833U5X1_JUGRE|nr:hypothetical protein F2P56_023658 [Juglans regia]
MEEGATSRSLLQKQKLDDNEELIRISCGEEDEGLLLQSDQSSSTITVVVVLSTLIAACGSYAFGNAVGYSSPAESGIEDDLGLGSEEYAVFGSVLTIGAILGAISSGKFADFFGRRGAMGAAEMFCILGWLAMAFSKDAWLLDLGRFLVGCGIGVLSYVVPVYIAEITPKNVRGGFTSLSQEYTENLQLISEDGIRHLFQKKYAYLIMIGVGLMVFQQLGGLNGFGFYASTIFESAGCSIKLGTIAAAVVQISMTAVGVFLIDKCGRLPLLLISAAGSCIGCLLTGFAFFLQDLQCGKDLVAMMVLIGVLVYWASFELGMGGIPWIMMSEIFPINIKGSAGSLVTLVSWIGSWLTSYTFNFLFEWSSAGPFFIYAGVCGMGVLFIAKMVPETKKLALEEIQASITVQ